MIPRPEGVSPIVRMLTLVLAAAEAPVYSAAKNTNKGRTAPHVGKLLDRFQNA